MPSDEVVDRAIEMIGRRGDAYAYFFDHLTSAEWISPLQARGFFAQPPEPIRSEHSTHSQLWPESGYLARVAQEDPELVAQVFLDLPHTENVRVYEDMAAAALAVPPATAGRLVPRLVEGLQTSPEFRLADHLSRLVERLAAGGEPALALQLGLEVLAFDEHATGEQTYGDMPTRLERWDFERHLDRLAPVLTGVDAEAFADFLARGLVDSLARSGMEPPSDFSYIWRPAIEPSSQNADHDLRSAVIEALRQSLEASVVGSLERLNLAVGRLERRGWSLFRRLALHLVRVSLPSSLGLARGHLLDRELHGEPQLFHEFWLLARDTYPLLEPRDQEDFLAILVEESHRDAEGEAGETGHSYGDFSEWRRYNILGREHLHGEWAERYDGLAASMATDPNPEFLVGRVETRMGATSPVTTEELQAMTIEEILTYLSTWRSDGTWDSPTEDGLAATFASVVAGSPQTWAASAAALEDLMPIYVRSFFEALSSARKAGEAFDWKPVFALAEAVTADPARAVPPVPSHREADPSWSWTHHAVLSLVSEAMERDGDELPKRFRAEAWRIIQNLLQSSEPTPEHEQRYGGSNMDALTLSLNVTRGQALHAAFRYGLWLRRSQLEETFEDAPELAEALERHLGSDEPSLAVRAAYGRWFPWLVLLDAEWARDHVDAIFPASEDKREAFFAAWGAYLFAAGVFDSVVEILAGKYELAVTLQPSEPEPDRGRDLWDRLGEHLTLMYLRGLVDLSPESLFARWLAVAPPVTRGHAIAFIGRVFADYDDEVPPERLTLAMQLWDERWKVVAIDPETTREELRGFGLWIRNASLPEDWVAARIGEIVDLPIAAPVYYDIAQCLPALAETRPRDAALALRRMVIMSKPWDIAGWEDEARITLSIAIASEDAVARDAATETVHRLGALGYHAFRDLVSGQ